jgi:hypothetical protein
LRASAMAPAKSSFCVSKPRADQYCVGCVPSSSDCTVQGMVSPHPAVSGPRPSAAAALSRNVRGAFMSPCPAIFHRRK